MRKIIAEGNHCKASYFTTTGTADYHLGIKDMSDDEYQVIYEDGLYKLFKNGELKMAATSVLITVTDFTKLNKRQ